MKPLARRNGYRGEFKGKKTGWFTVWHGSCNTIGITNKDKIMHELLKKFWKDNDKQHLLQPITIWLGELPNGDLPVKACMSMLCATVMIGASLRASRTKRSS